MKHELPPLPYAYDSLAPVLSEETLRFHHDKHHKAYVDKLNQLLPGSGFENASLEEIVLKGEGKIFNQAAQAWNHTFLWRCLRPESDLGPGQLLADAINSSFGSLDKFQERFNQTAVDLFGSGWAWLAKNSEGKLEILGTKDADNPLRHRMTPVLTCDVWEHAYYIDYRNERAKYVKNTWRIMNWEFAERAFSSTPDRLLKMGSSIRSAA